MWLCASKVKKKTTKTKTNLELNHLPPWLPRAAHCLWQAPPSWRRLFLLILRIFFSCLFHPLQLFAIDIMSFTLFLKKYDIKTYIKCGNAIKAKLWVTLRRTWVNPQRDSARHLRDGWAVPEEARPLGCPWFAGCSDSPVFMPLQPHFPIKEMYTQTWVF